MNDEKTEKSRLTISVKVPREKRELPSCPKYGWIAFIAIVLLLIGSVLGMRFCNCAEVSLGIGPMIESWTLKILHYHLMLAIMFCLGFAFILLLLYFVYCRYVLGIVRENRKAEKDRMDFVSHQLDMLKDLVVAPVKRQNTETINVVITHLKKGGNGGAGSAKEDPKDPNGGGDGVSLAYSFEMTSSPLSSDYSDYKNNEN